MQIKVDLKIMIVALLFFMTNQLEIYVILLAFAVLHECGPAIATNSFFFAKQFAFLQLWL